MQERETVLRGAFWRKERRKKIQTKKTTLTCLRPSQLYKTETHKLSMLKSVCGIRSNTECKKTIKKIERESVKGLKLAWIRQANNGAPAVVSCQLVVNLTKQLIGCCTVC